MSGKVTCKFFYRKTMFGYNICREDKTNEKGYIDLYQLNTEEQAINEVNRLNQDEDE